MPWFKDKFGEWRPWTKNVGSLLLMWFMFATLVAAAVIAYTGWTPNWLAERN